MSEERTPPVTMERESAPTVYHTARTQSEDACCLKDSLSYPRLRPKERKTLQFANGNSEDDEDVSDTPPRSAIKAKSNGKMERSPHSTRHSGTSKRAAVSGPSGRQKRPKPALSGQKSSLLARYQTHHLSSHPQAKERTCTYLYKHITQCFD